MYPLDKIFKPSSIAAIGVSDRPGTVGYAIMDNLLKGGFQGKIYPVNPGHPTIRGKKSFPSVKKIPGTVDLAVIAVPAKAVLGVLKECGEAGIGGAIIITAGFRESGPEGKRMYDEIGEVARQYDIRIIGPNCLGIIAPALGLNASFASRMALPGKIAFISQSGALCTAILDWSVSQSVGFSHFVSIGEMVDVGYHDLIDYFGADQQTACILIYMESLSDPRKFMSAARAFARQKPIIILKAGQSLEGAKATLSHTGSLAGNDAAYDAAFRRAGIIRVDTISQLFHVAQALAMQPRPNGNRLAILTNAGGPAVLATDFLMKNGGQLATLSPTTIQELNKFLPEHWSHGDPVDVLGDTPAVNYGRALDLILKDENVDGVLTITASQAVISEAEIAKHVVNISKTNQKTLLACWMGETDVADGRELLEEGGIPSYRYPEEAVHAFLRMYRYARALEFLYETPTTSPEEFLPNKEKAAGIIRTALDAGRLTLTEPEGKQLLSCYDIPIARNEVAETAEAAVIFATEIGFPVVMKIDSPDIGHKVDVGGVLLNIRTEEEVRQAFNTLIANAKRHRPDAHIVGVLVEKMVSKDFELLIGAKKDPVFGPVIAFGMGGTAVEIFQDINLGLPPLNMALARRMIERTKVFQLLQGYRGRPGVDLLGLQFLLVKFSYLVMDFPEIKEVDINPYAVDVEGGVVLDSHIVLEKLPAHEGRFTFDHLVISPYPDHFTKEVLMKNGQTALFRPIRPEDEPLEAEMFEKLSRESIYFRFFGYVPKISHKFLVHFTHIDYDRELAIVAEVEEQGRRVLAGVVRLVNDYSDRSAEFAIIIADPWQREGLGGQMMDYMIEIARQRGLERMHAEALSNNEVMLAMFEHRGFKLLKRDGTSYKVELTLV
ncbi:MAG: bifunctional acetate--CoA ligase family protein/GNAT family N-acetyltransferase [Saprospiraceae bacterium]|nr:bifunctional acetate--CoA ligase family protein/GNAT family N-acetyltransferase [Saprospiraceae bacterium]MCF8252912.1 bifunctional acetate--CoA ligase family protein/GNAT family N-acetyltransferase [Saprospiraceae bacterium]MCF8314458.1 bifunctional acetate--CoA ligase family protein/GNAT family N-acetyltransferase [Saprospiraceae bacterium]MCF8443343.1 bifunctional acetate--CoA ligase family protein/GNAT family N-acetyltransferase [Saprospiraceae bacterium]